MPDTLTPASPGFSHRDILYMLSGTMLGMFLGALDQTIVATALPAMAGALHGIESMSWVVSGYLLTSTAATPIYGKLSDLYGRRPLFIVAIGLFLLGSLMCGLAQTMPHLIAGRAVQGMGGGGLISLAQTIIADIVPPRERGRYQAYFSAVWSVSTLGGPMLGGFLVDSLSWRWVFWINLPVAVLGLIVCNSALKKLPVHGRTKKIDYLGATLMVPAIVALLLVTTWGGTEFAWASPVVLGLLALAVIGNSLAFLMGAASVGATIFLPLFLQVVIGATASNSGLLITPMMIGITIGATLTGRFIRYTGRYKMVPLIGLSIATASFLLFVGVGRGTPALVYAAYMTALGFGLGPAGPMVSIAVQNAVELRDLGTATSLTSFFRSMGGSFGVALMGAILFAGLTPQTQGGAAGLSASGLLHGGPAMIAALPDAVRQLIVASFAHSFRYVYLTGAGMCVLGLGLAIFIEELPLRSRAPQPAPPLQAPPPASAPRSAEPAEAKSE